MMTLLDAIGPAVWRASWQAGLLALFVTLVLWALGERVTPRWRYLLWSVVMVRFLFVVTPASPWSVFNVVRFGRGDVEEVVAQEAPEAWVGDGQWSVVRGPLEGSFDRTTGSVQEGGASPIAGEDGSDFIPSEVGTVNDISVVTAPLGEHSERPAETTISMERVLVLCWLAGCVACVVRLIVAGIGLRRRLRVCRVVTDGRVLEVLAAACRELGFRYTPALLVTPEPVSPCLVGTWRPRIVVPESLMTDGASLPLRQVLAHELAHIVRRDQWTNWLLLGAGLVHWFNPLAWWTLREMRAEREAACDDMALALCEEGNRNSYAETILEFVSGRSPSPIAPGMIGLFSSQQRVARRMKRLLRTPAVAPLGPVIVAGLLVVLGLVGLTDGMPADDGSAAVEAEQAADDVESTPMVDLEPHAGDYVIHGYCTDMDQVRLEGVRLRLFVVHGLVEPPVEIAETTSDEDGRFEFTGLTPPRNEMEVDLLSYGVVAEAEGRPLAATLEIFRQTHPRDELWLRLESGEAAALTGRVTNEQGEPVAGAIVSRYEIARRPVPGVHTAVTDEKGLFAITNLPPVAPDPERPERVHFRIHHPDYPVTSAAAPMLPADVEVVLPAGCTVTGQVLDGATGKPVPGVIVAAENSRHPSEDRIAVTDAEGRYRLAVTEEDYNIVVKSADGVAVAVTDRDCQTGKTVELPPLSLTSGGVIAGRVVNAETGEPVVTSDNGRVAVGLYGPAHPPREGIISPTRQVVVDDDGYFTLRAAAGDNFPYLVNIRGQRMAWDTREQEPVVVREGETVSTEILIVPQKSAEEKMEAARRVLASLPEKQTERVAQIIEEFRKLNHTVDETEVWCLLMRDLVGIGSDAVPQLSAELDQTTEGRMLRRLGFALRAIGDPRAVPALIRAIPNVLNARGGDYGLLVEDAELLAFMQKHDWNSGRGGRYFDFERPFREIVGALQKLTGQDFNDATLENVSLSDDPRGQILQRRLFQRHALRWQEWWESHWREFTDDAAYATVKLTLANEPLPPAPTRLGPDAQAIARVTGKTLSPASENGRFIQHFLDLDTGYQPDWPDGVPRSEESVEGDELSSWAAENGVDLMCVTHELPNGTRAYVLRAFDMQVREISARDLQRMDRLVSEGALPEGRPVGELLLHYDAESEQYVAENGAFLYVTREGCMGVIEVTDRITRVADLTGLVSAPPSTGFHKGVKFNLTTIVP